MSSGVFVTGTDTGIGKTLIACALIDRLVQAGIDAGGFKPIAAGGYRTPTGWRNEDAERLMEHGSVALDYAQINPIALPEAIAPHIAAARSGVELSIPALVRDYAALRQLADCVVIEGAGGWLVPLDDRHSMADLAAALGSPVLLVVGIRLGCLNHALLTVADIRRRGLPFAGWIANCIDPAMAELEANIATLDQAIPSPRLGLVPWLDDRDHAARVAGAAAALDIERILPRIDAA
ncbi:MAG: dethiobiotin synthase [Gammaproteobacteria bacterium]